MLCSNNIHGQDILPHIMVYMGWIAVMLLFRHNAPKAFFYIYLFITVVCFDNFFPQNSITFVIVSHSS